MPERTENRLGQATSQILGPRLIAACSYQIVRRSAAASSSSIGGADGGDVGVRGINPSLPDGRSSR